MALQLGTENAGARSTKPWPYCENAGGNCPSFDMGHALGRRILATFVAFVASAEPGSRLTLQRNRRGFSLQVTGAVQKSNDGDADLVDLHELRYAVESLREQRKRG